MKHLVAISAHKNAAHLKVFVRELLEMDMQVLIHIDSKTRKEMLQGLGDYQHYVIPTSINVKRGHISIVRSTIALMEEAKKIDFDYFHLVSGEDFISKPAKKFESFFGQYHGKEFINHNTLPISAEPKKVADLPFSIRQDQLPVSNYLFPFFKNGIGLVDTYHFQESSALGKVVGKLTKYNTFVKAYQKVFKRKLPSHSFYAGSAWMSITKRAVDYFIDYSNNHPKLLKHLSNSLFPDEIYFQTIAMQSPFREDIIDSDLRFIDWDNEIDFGPALLGINHCETLRSSSGFFSRKWDLSHPEVANDVIIKLLK